MVPAFKAVVRLFLLLAVAAGGCFLAGSAHARDVSGEVSQARAAGVPETSLSRILALGVDHSVPSENMAVYLHVLQAAAEESIPITPFVDKVEEGLGKRVAPQRISAALTRKLDNYRLAQEIVATTIRPRPGTFEPKDLIPLGESLDLGITPEELVGFLEQAPDAPLSMLLIAIENLALLKQVAMDMDLAQELLFKALDHRVLDDGWQTLPKAVAAARAHDLSDAAIVSAVSRVIDQKGDAAQIWRELGIE